MIDFELADHGSVHLLKARSPEARAWIHEFLPAGTAGWGDFTAIETRFVGPIVDGIIAADLTIAEQF